MEISTKCDFKVTCGLHVCLWGALWSELAIESLLYVKSACSAVEPPDLKFVVFGRDNAICCFMEISIKCDIKVMCGLYVFIRGALRSEFAIESFWYVKSACSAAEEPYLKFVIFGLENAICCFMEISKKCDIKVTCGLYVCLWGALWSEFAIESYWYVKSACSAAEEPYLEFVIFGLCMASRTTE